MSIVDKIKAMPGTNREKWQKLHLADRRTIHNHVCSINSKYININNWEASFNFLFPYEEEKKETK